MKINLLNKILIYLIFVEINFADGLYQIIDLPTDSRSLSMNNGASAYNYIYLQNNPATLSQSSSNFGFHFLNLPQNISSIKIDFSKSLIHGVFASQLSILDFGILEDKKNNSEFSAQDILISAAYKFSILEMISCGISGGYYYSNIENYFSDLLLFNSGFKTQINQYRFGLSVSIENVSYMLNNYTNIEAKPPILLRLSTYYKPLYIPINIHLDLYKLNNGNFQNYITALEFSPNKRIVLRLGANNERKNLMTGNFTKDFFSGISGGVGFQFNKNRIESSFKNLGSAGLITSISFSYKMN